MSVRTEVKRTLVKSPPELWSELSEPEALARHFDGFEQIRITRAEHEAAVEWEAEGASGSVRLQPSGFGTKVTLCLSRELPSPPDSECSRVEPPLSESLPPAPAPPVLEPAPLDEPPLYEPQITGAIAAEHEPEPLENEVPRRRFFARLFKRRPKQDGHVGETTEARHEPEPEAAATVESEPDPIVTVESQPEPAATVEPQAGQAATGEPERTPDPVEAAVSVTADLAALEAEMAEQNEAMLIAMLDRLGSAHHRPFSRS